MLICTEKQNFIKNHAKLGEKPLDKIEKMFIISQPASQPAMLCASTAC